MTTTRGQRDGRRARDRAAGAHRRGTGLLVACAALAAILAAAAIGQAAGTFSIATLTGDADSGVRAYKTYTHAYDISRTGNLYVNDVEFIGIPGTLPQGSNFSTTGWSAATSADDRNTVTGAIGDVTDTFCYGVASPAGTQTLTLTGLTAGKHYITTFYNTGWTAAGGRWQMFSVSDLGYMEADEDSGGPGMGSMFIYDYVAQDTSITFTIQPFTGDSYHLFGFTNELVEPNKLLVDTFAAPGNPNKHDLGYNLANRQGGSLAGTTYSTPSGANVQLGNAAFRLGGNNLMLTWDTSVSPDVNLNAANSAGGLRIAFKMTPDAVGGGTDDMVAGIALGMSQADRFSDAEAATTHFGILFGSATGAFKAYDGATQVGSSTHGPLWAAANGALHNFEILLTDPTDGNPFDGVNQTHIEVRVDNASVFTYTKAGGGYTDNYLNFQASEIALIDDLGIYRISETAAAAVPEPATVALLAGAVALLALWRVPRRLNLVVGLVLALAAGAQAAGVFTTGTFTGDGDSGISGAKCYMMAFDAGADGILDVNGALFTGTGYNIFNPANNTGSTTGFPYIYHGWTTHYVSGNTGRLMQDFLYGGMTGASLTMNNLRVGQQYKATFLNAAWDNPVSSPRWMQITTTDGGSVHFEESFSGLGNGNKLDYAFTAQATSLTFTIMPDITDNRSFHLYAFTNELVGYKPLLYDTFEARGNPDLSNLAFKIADRQTGSLEQITYSKKSGSIVQLDTQTLAAEFGSSLLFRTDSMASPDHNFKGASAAGGLLVSFDLAPDALGSTSGMLAGINLGMSQADRFSSLADAAAHFGIRFEGLLGAFEAYDGSTQVGSGSTTWSATPDGGPEMHHFDLVLTDSGDGNPLNGSGQTKIDVYVDGSPIFSYTKTNGGYSENYLNFEVNRLAVLDNLLIAQIGGGAAPGPGDANGDGAVNELDAAILAANWLKTGGAAWEEGDFNGDGNVDDLDASILAANWLSGAGGTAVPEPATLALLAGLGLAAVLLRRRAVG